MCVAFVHARLISVGILGCFGTVQAAMNTTMKKKGVEWGPEHRTLGFTKMEYVADSFRAVRGVDASAYESGVQDVPQNQGVCAAAFLTIVQNKR
jgi:hypothetical protein